MKPFRPIAEFSSDSVSGFTMIELLIYVAFMSIMATVFVNFALDIAGSAQKARVRQEVQQNARLAMDRMLQEARATEGLNVGGSVFGSHPGILSLATSVPATNPTVFDVSGGVLRMTQGVSSPVTLTASNLQVSNLVFENLTLAGRTQHVRITFTLRHPNPDNNEIYNASVTLYGSAVLRELVD